MLFLRSFFLNFLKSPSKEHINKEKGQVKKVNVAFSVVLFDDIIYNSFTSYYRVQSHLRQCNR